MRRVKSYSSYEKSQRSRVSSGTPVLSHRDAMYGGLGNTGLGKLDKKS